MAPLKIIGAGYGRTGTDSLRRALNRLGYKTHHMVELNEPGQRPELFVEQYNHPESNHWDTIYQGFDAAVDWPTAAFVEPLMRRYPDAKVILTERDPDAWVESMKNTILAPCRRPYSEERKSSEANIPPQIRARLHMVDIVVLDGMRTRRPEDITDNELKKLFLEHNSRIKATVPKEKLLVMDTANMNWEILCEFLGISEIPLEPFPNGNSATAAKSKFEKYLQSS
ncbi:hypothetical protein BCR43DRAFT_493343 [Syncephalastrum racemosum]|uniref:P-loop containing nucleoside triphosphate hydrolase protein n=1 Tax=Syncephalastrum racemosum TaxID=13706 RepID=A0A1X2HAD9_SYNRA|nr:hypothetical protein BCR43DRAFT_493343 [Syncephalastrum racemosum]